MTERPPGGDPSRGARHRPARSVQTPAQRRRIEDVARGAAFDVLREVAESDAYANLVLPPMLRARRITGRDAGFATELAYGTLRLRGRYDAIIAQVASRDLATIDPPVLDLLRLGSHQLLGMRVPAHAAVSETVALARSRAGAGSAQFVNAVLRKISGRELAEWLATIDATMPNDPLEALAVRESHPSWILRAMREALVGHGRAVSELEALLRADNEAPEVTLVARPGLVEAADLIAELHGSARPGPWTPTAVRMSGGDPGAIRAVRDGRAGVQDEGSQLVTLALVAADVTTAGGPDAHGETWLDLCAGPGGKAALLAALAAQRGARLVANEVLPHRALLVERSLVAIPAGVVEVRCGDGRAIGAQEPGRYDRVLLDAPCTGLGALRRRPEARWRRMPADLSALGVLQRELLTSAIDACRPGGVVAYVTCSPHLAETTFVVKDVLRKRTDAEVIDATAAVLSASGGPMDLGPGPSVQLWPHVHLTDAMHLTLIRRTDAAR